MKDISRYLYKIRTKFYFVVENVGSGSASNERGSAILHLCSKSNVSNANPDGQKLL